MTACRVMLCDSKAEGLIKILVMQGEEARARVLEIASCEPCADSIGIESAAGHRAHLTPDGFLYMGNLDRLLRRRTA